MIGMGVMTVGLLLLTQLEINTSGTMISLYMFVVGIGPGPTMPVGTTSIQNAVPQKQMGAATAGFTLFRQVGGLIGVSVFGTLFSSSLRESFGGQDMGGGVCGFSDWLVPGACAAEAPCRGRAGTG